MPIRATMAKNYNWLIFPVNLQLKESLGIIDKDYNWLIFPVNLQPDSPP